MVSTLKNLLRRTERNTSANKMKLIPGMSENNNTLPSCTTEESTSLPTPPEIIVEPALEPEEEIHPMTSATIQEVIIESNGKKPEANGQPAMVKCTVIESDEEVTNCGCTASLQNGLNRVKHVVDDMPKEYKEAACYSGLFSISMAILFSIIVIYRAMNHFLHPDDDGFFCRYFSTPFAPMFDALCHENVELLPELYAQTSRLLEEIFTGFGDFVHKIFDGFHAMGTIFWALFGNICEDIGLGIHELTENVSENISFLVRFCVDFVAIIFKIFANIISSSINHLIEALNSIQHLVLRN